MPLHSLTGEQIRAARALARIDQAELARRARLSLETIKRLERIRGPVEANVRTLNAIAEVFEAIGVRFEGRRDGTIAVCGPGSAFAGARADPVHADERPSDRPAGAAYRLIYFSAASADAPPIRLLMHAINRSARLNNAGLGVTGALLASNGRFLQALEGDKQAVQQLYGAITLDPRHRDLVLLEGRMVSSRQFADWSLCCGVFASDTLIFAHEPSMATGFRPELLTPASALGLLATMRDLQAAPPRSGRGEPGTCAISATCLDRQCATAGGDREPRAA